MKDVVQFTQDDLETLIGAKLSEDGIKVIPAEYTITFVTGADGKTSALVTGCVKEAEEPEEAPAPTNTLEGLDQAVRVGLRLLLTYKPQTQLRLQEKLLDHIDADDFEDFSTQDINAFVITNLQKWEREGTVEYVEDKDAWKKSRTQMTAADAASDILNGSGGATSRGDALGAGLNS